MFPFDRPSRRQIFRKIERRRPFLGATVSGIDTLRAVLIRISFLSDRDDELSTLASDGNFNLSHDDVIIDPPPHNRRYFNSHMVGLRNYIWFQSGGKVELEWVVLPEELNESYKLTDLADYGPGQSGSWTTEKLVQFFKDSICKADTAEGLSFPWGDYDAIIVAHAGANLQSDIDYDTPNDIPSFFAGLGDEDAFEVSSGDTIWDGSVIPETAVQDGFNGGIAGVLIHEFCHQLGLPDLYNINFGNPTIGVWGLMDSGGLLGAWFEDGDGEEHYVEGFMPGGLSAWSRTYLGWTTVDTVKTFTNVMALPAVEKESARVVRIEMGEDEYLLLENRVAELDGIKTVYVRDENGVIIGTRNCIDCSGNIAPPDPEWPLVNGYDKLLPTEREDPSYDGGPGLLVWHIDERLIEQRWEENTINTFKPFGVWLVEAGGVVDLGDPSSPFGWGWFDDAYYQGNNETLSDSTLPPSWSNWNVPTGVRVEHVSSRDTLMSFGAGVRDRLATKLIGSLGTPAPDGILPLSGDYRALVVDLYGRGRIAGSGSYVFSLHQRIMTPPAMAAEFAPGIDAVIIGEQQGVIHLFQDSDWTEPEGWPYEGIMGNLITHPVVIASGEGHFVTAADDAGFFYLIDHTGEDFPGFSPHALLEPDRVLGNIVVSVDTLYRTTGLFLLTGSAAPSRRAWLLGWDISGIDQGVSPVMLAGYPQFVDLTAAEIDGRISLVGGNVDPLHTGDELYVVLHTTGRVLLCGNGRILAERNRETYIRTTPALYDLNGDSYLDLIFSDGEYVYAINPSGANLTGWPRRPEDLYQLPGEVGVSAPVTVAHTESGPIVLIGTRQGLLYRLDRFGELVGYPWKIARGFAAALDILIDGGDGILFFMDGGYSRWRYGRFENADETGLALSFHSWHSTWGDRARTAFAVPARPLDGIPASDWLNLDRDLVVYPNPSNGHRVGFHFTAPESGEAQLSVLTLSGELVLERRKILIGGQDEFVVSMSDKASGIYLCRLVVRSGGKETEAYRKFALVR
ncbi:MAG: immune inhibitor A [bacterium]|nr:MAG: immune inhibitor A [bacterium]